MATRRAGVARGRGNFNSGPASPHIRSARRWSVAVGRTRRPTTALHSSKQARAEAAFARSLSLSLSLSRPRSSFGKEGRKTAAAAKKKEGRKDDSGRPAREEAACSHHPIR